MENLSRCHREKSGKRLLPHSTYILQHKNDIVKNNKYGEKVVFCFIKPKRRKINNSVCRKSMFFKKSACPQSLSPNPFPCERLCMLCWLCIVQSLCAYTPGIRAGAECGATAPRPCRGLRPCDPIFKKYRFIDSLWQALLSLPFYFYENLN